MPAARQNDNLDLMQCAGLGVQLAATVALCTYLGYLADQWLDTLPIALIVGAFFGLGSGMWSAVRTVNRVTGQSPSEPSAGQRSDDDASP